MRRALPRFALVALLVLAAVALLPAVAAHSECDNDSTPRRGQVLEVAPPRVEVQCTEPLEPGSYVRVVDAQNRRVDAGDVQFANQPRPHMSVGLPTDLPPGAYSLVWRTFSSTDGHVLDGRIGFAIGDFEPPPSQSHDQNHLDWPAAASRAGVYVGYSLVFGAAAFQGALRRSGMPFRAPGAALLWGTTAVLAGTLLLGQLTLREVGVTWAQIGQSKVGRIMLARLLLAAGAWVFAILFRLRPTRFGPWVAVSFSFASAIAAAMVGHGAADGPATAALDLLHLVATTVWVGGLILFMGLLWRAKAAGTQESQLRALGIRYGTVALACVVTLWFTGLIVGLAILGREAVLHPGPTLASAWGAFLLAKMALAALMVAIAAINRYVFLEEPALEGVTGAIQRAAHRVSGGRIRPLQLHGSGLRTAITVEAALGVIVLVLAGLLTAVSPPNTAAGPEPQSFLAQGDFYVVRMGVEPAPRVGGGSTLHFTIQDAASGARLQDNTCGRSACLQADIRYADAAGMETHPVTWNATSWLVDDLVWTRAGPATITLLISSADFFGDKATFNVTVDS